MAVEVIMPALGLAQETGRLLRWIKVEGDRVAVGDLLMEIETDKSAVQIEASGTGFLRGVRVQPGEEVGVGTVMAWILAEAEALPAGPAAEAPAIPTPAAGDPEPVLAGDSDPVGSAGGELSTVAAATRPAASPLARRLAAERGIELAAGGGGGPDGAYLAADLATAEPAKGQPSASRRRMAAHTTQVWVSTPHFYLSRDVRARRLRDWLAALRRRTGLAVTYTDLLIRTVGAAVKKHPEMGGYWASGEIRHRSSVHVGLAIATPGGLLLGTVRDVDQLELAKLVEARSQLVQRAQAGRLLGSDLEGAILTISNLGMFGVDRFGAVLTDGQSSLLAVGRIRDEVVPVDGRPAVEPVLSLTLSCDHRVLDGAQAAPFLNEVTEYLEEPELLLDD
jgi:pyruvate dehydrogenase E2 component (dihydrolipoamide acetyltransferase)